MVLAQRFQVQPSKSARSGQSNGNRGETTGLRWGEHAGVGFGPAHEGALMKKLGIAMAIAIAAVGAAHAADLPTTKPRGPAAGELLFEPLGLHELNRRGLPADATGRSPPI